MSKQDVELLERFVTGESGDLSEVVEATRRMLAERAKARHELEKAAAFVGMLPSGCNAP